MRFLIPLFFFWAASAAGARDFTVATVDMRTLFKEYPGTFRAQQKFDDMAQEKKQDLADSEEALSDLQKELSAPKNTFSSKERRRKEKEFEEETQDYENEKNRIQAELDERNQEMTRLLMGRIRDVVSGIAKKEGVDLVLDSNDAVVVKGRMDLTDEVLRSFAGMKPDQTDLNSDGP